MVAVGADDAANSAVAEYADGVTDSPYVRTCHSTSTPFAYVPPGNVHDERVDVTAVTVVHEPAPASRCSIWNADCGDESVGLCVHVKVIPAEASCGVPDGARLLGALGGDTSEIVAVGDENAEYNGVPLDVRCNTL